MTNESNSDVMAEAVKKHAELILRAQGTSLSNYTFGNNRQKILSAVMDCYKEAHKYGADCCEKFIFENADALLQKLKNEAATAQDLLEALESYMFAEEIDDTSLRESELSIARQDARAAIAKAKGDKA